MLGRAVRNKVLYRFIVYREVRNRACSNFINRLWYVNLLNKIQEASETSSAHAFPILYMYVLYIAVRAS